MSRTMTIGDRVVTTLDPTINDWQIYAIETRRDDINGTIESEHNSHGHFFGVRHDDGVLSYYEPQELEVIN